jgi:DsbC/DsbD-like thiol-disulfide interchange protein
MTSPFARRARRIAIPVLALAASALFVVGEAEAQDPVHWTAEAASTSVAPGGTLTLAVKAVIDPGWYIYSITQGEGGPVPSRVSLAEEQPFSLAASVTGTKPKVKFDENFSMEVEVHEGQVAYTVPVEVASGADAGATEILIRARYQACTNRVCLPAQTEKISLPVKIVSKSKLPKKKG